MKSTNSQLGSALPSNGRVTLRGSYSKPLVAHQLIRTHQARLKSFIKLNFEDEESVEALFGTLKQMAQYSLLKFESKDQGRYRNLILRHIVSLLKDKQEELGGATQSFELCNQEMGLAFKVMWRESVLDQAWHELRKIENSMGRPVYSAYRSSVEYPELTIEQLMHKSSLCAPIQTPNSFKLLLRDSRQYFLKILKGNIAKSLQAPTESDVQDELNELGLNFH